MARQPHEPLPAETELDSADTPVDGGAGSRRQFLQYGAFTAIGLAGCSSTATPGDDDMSSGGMPGAGGTGMPGGAGKPGTGGTGGTGMTTGGAPGTGGTGGTGATGGTPGGPAGAPGSGGATGAAGATGTAGGAGGATAAAGGATGMGGASATGGAPPTAGSGPVGGTGGTGGTGGMPMTGGGKENNGAACTLTGMPPTFANAVTNAKLPDPFKFINGMRIAKKEDWACLRNELSLMLQACIYGPKPPAPDTLDATFSGGKLTINMKVGTTTKSFSVTISGGGSAASPVPCLITCGGSSLPALQGVAKIDMSNQTFASEMSQSGMIYDLYGNAAQKSGALIGWAWGLSRIIDALEKVPEAGINTKRIAVTGCSRNGKGALAMGAFDERVALTIPQEGGSGGTALWRVSQKEKAMGQNIQESGEIVGEARWQGSDFKQYANGQNDKLSADQHFAVALCAPRAILVIENDIDWLGPVATYGGGVAGRKVFEALGVKDRCGVSVASNHSHCQFPSGQQTYLNNFVNRFLKGMQADTAGVDELHTQSTTSKLGKFDEATWIDWTVPTLSGNLAWDPFA